MKFPKIKFALAAIGLIASSQVYADEVNSHLLLTDDAVTAFYTVEEASSTVMVETMPTDKGHGYATRNKQTVNKGETFIMEVDGSSKNPLTTRLSVENIDGQLKTTITTYTKADQNS